MRHKNRFKKMDLSVFLLLLVLVYILDCQFSQSNFALKIRFCVFLQAWTFVIAEEKNTTEMTASVWTVSPCARLGSLYPHQWNIKTTLSDLLYRCDNQIIWIMLSCSLFCHALFDTLHKGDGSEFTLVKNSAEIAETKVRVRIQFPK